ncbi:MAG TPA: NAD(P)/FAD-dependent oxidoreductase [Steroidobacteraceae bacterium]
MKPTSDTPINIVGAGLAGALLAVLLARRGFTVRVFERRPDPRRSAAERGRSINLALAARGIAALERAGVMDRVRPLLIPMRGRMVHDRAGTTALLPYGQRSEEVIYSVGRALLNKVLIEEAARHSTVSVRFDQACIGVDPSRNTLRFRDIGAASAGSLPHASEYDVPLGPTIATDGAGSVIRSSLASSGHLCVQEEFLDHDYKELTLPAISGRPALDGNALHIWPRGGFMLIALPNTDNSFTATLFLARRGANSFDSDVVSLFEREFPDTLPLIPNLIAELRDHPRGTLGTVHTAPFHVGNKVLLLGDAAHAIVPFHGQGMNAAFEDCAALDALLDQNADWGVLFAQFSCHRRPNTEAIAQMALENYTEMRDTVLDPKFARQKSVALELERRFPRRFIPRYAMVMFHPEIPYSEALRRGSIQAEILDHLDGQRGSDGKVDLTLAEMLITQRLSDLAAP